MAPYSWVIFLRADFEYCRKTECYLEYTLLVLEYSTKIAFFSIWYNNSSSFYRYESVKPFFYAEIYLRLRHVWIWMFSLLSLSPVWWKNFPLNNTICSRSYSPIQYFELEVFGFEQPSGSDHKDLLFFKGRILSVTLLIKENYGNMKFSTHTRPTLHDSNLLIS